ncbi:MAG: hypothetical protein ABL899_03105 [Nitrospira sp.]
MEPQAQESSIGSIIGTIIIIAIIILGGLYFWGKRIEENKAKQALVEETVELTPAEMEANTIKSITPSDDLTSIEADLNGTNVNNLSSEINAQ